MKAWEVHNGRLNLRDVSAPCPAVGEALIHVRCAGICGSDIPKLLSPGSFAIPDPWRPGHEVVGTDPTGRTVVVDPLVPCGACQHCGTGDCHLCAGLRRLGWDLPGGFAEQLVIPAANAHPAPIGNDPLHAVLADPVAVAIHGLRCNPVGPLERLAVIGAGTIGLLSALYADQEGWEVTVVHRDDRRPTEALAKVMPCIFRSSAAALKAARGSFAVVIDAATGANPTPFDLALQLVRDGGTIIVQNAYHPGVRYAASLRDLFRRSIRVIGSFSHCRQQPGDFVLALDLLGRHATQTAQLIAPAGELGDLPTVLSNHRARSVRAVLLVAPS